MIFNDFSKAVAQLSDRRFRRVLWIGLGLTLALLVAAYAGILWLVASFSPETVTLPVFGEVTWVSDLISGASVVLMIILSAFLMVPVASAFTSLFLDDVAQAVEDRHYPHLVKPPKVPFSSALADSLNFLVLLVVANLFAFILYGILIITVVFAPMAPVVFWVLNGYLLGREYFQLVAMRRMSREEAKELFRANSTQIWLAGSLMAIPLSIPVINLLIPILGAATFTHLFHRLDR